MSGKFKKIKWKVPSFNGEDSVTFHTTINTCNYILNSPINRMLSSCYKVKNFDFCNDPLRSKYYLIVLDTLCDYVYSIKTLLYFYLTGY